MTKTLQLYVEYFNTSLVSFTDPLTIQIFGKASLAWLLFIILIRVLNLSFCGFDVAKADHTRRNQHLKKRYSETADFNQSAIT